MGRPRELTEGEKAELLAKGYRRVEMWVPDLDNPKILADLKKQATAVAEADEKDEIFDWLAEVQLSNDVDRNH